MRRPSGLALLPELDRRQLMRFVDNRKVKQNVIEWLKGRSAARKSRVRPTVFTTMASQRLPLAFARCTAVAAIVLRLSRTLCLASIGIDRC